MDPFTADYLANLAAELSALVAAALGRRLQEAWRGPEAGQALERSLHAGLVALLATASAQEPARQDLLADIFGDFLRDPDAGREIAGSLRGRPLDMVELAFLFEEAGYDAETLPGLDFEQGMAAFEAAFLTAAAAEPELQGTVQTHQLLEQTGLQRELVAQMAQLVAALRPLPAGSVSVGGSVGGSVVTGDHNQVIFQVQLAPPPEEPPQGDRQAYLNRVFEKTRHLSLGGIDPKAAAGGQAAQLQLGAVYTALLTSSSARMPLTEFVELGEAKAAEKLERATSALAQLDRQPHLMLLGDPGSGKSTFASFVAYCLAGEALGRQDANLALLTEPLPDDEGQPQEERQPWQHGPLLPVHVVLREFAASGLLPAGEAGAASHLWQFVESDLQAAALAEYAPHLKRALRDDGGLLLLDGLDEVPQAATRRRQIKQVVEDFAAAFPRVRILVTSRTYAYERQEWTLAGFRAAVLAPFSQGQIIRFVDRWYAHSAALGRLAADAQGRAESLKQAIFASERLLALAERPLLLTLMASLHAWRGGSLPQKREELYHEAVDLLLERWESQRLVHDNQGNLVQAQPSLLEWLKIDRDAMRRFLNALAYEAHAAQAELEGTADIDGDKLVGGLLRLSPNPDLRPQLLIEYLSDRAGLLQPHGVGVFSFPHRTFQEYLAACHLTDHDYPDRVAQLARQEPDRWREVALLAGAKAARGAAGALWSLVDALCYHEPDAAESDVADAWGARLAGQALSEATLALPLGERQQAKLERVQRWLVHLLPGDALPAVERAGAGRSLGLLGDPRPEVMDVDQMQFCLAPAGDFWLGSGDDDPQADDDEKPQHRLNLNYDYWIGRFPVTNAQFESFVADKGYEAAEYWVEAAAAEVWRDGLVYGHRQPRDFGRPFNLPNHPVVGVTWYEALAFTRWLGRRWREQGRLPEGWAARLPSEAEWEKAARGGLTIPKQALVRPVAEGLPAAAAAAELVQNPAAKRRFPWPEDESSPERANYEAAAIGASSAPGCFAAGRTPHGCEEMSGNVWEWCQTRWDDENNKVYPRPYRSDDGREELSGKTSILRVLRGGAYYSSGDRLRCAFRLWPSPDYRYYDVGFRVVVSPFPALASAASEL